MKTSNKLALTALVIFIAFPAASLYLNRVAGQAYSSEILSIVDSLLSDSITVLQYRSPKASPGLLYVAPARKTQHTSIVLNVQPKVNIAGDTLIITSTDNSAVYQGSVRLRNLREARFNETVRTFPTAPKAQPDSLPRDTVATDSIKTQLEIQHAKP